MKNHVLTISRTFPTTHKRKGEPTNFLELIESGLKRHTIRGNYELWEKRIKEVQAGKAVLSIRYWSGKPYNSKQRPFKCLTVDDGVGIQKVILETPFKRVQIDGVVYCSENFPNRLAKNDGLSRADFDEWFKKADKTKPMALIHFTKFRYN